MRATGAPIGYTITASDLSTEEFALVHQALSRIIPGQFEFTATVDFEFAAPADPDPLDLDPRTCDECHHTRHVHNGPGGDCAVTTCDCRGFTTRTDGKPYRGTACLTCGHGPSWHSPNPRVTGCGHHRCQCAQYVAPTPGTEH